jgi:pimeloyl-ACP methyl ester carboxylesterase
MKHYRMTLAVSVMLASLQLLAQAQGRERSMEHPSFYRTIQIDGLSIFYREAGPKDAPVLLLLHGLPSSSRMFEPLFARLSDCYHLVAPDYPGFGHSDWPDSKKFAYTFDHYAEIMNHFTEALGLSRFTMYMQDYGGPVGFRMALAHPERIEALIVQDAVAHNEGLGANWKTRRAFWADRAANESALRTNLLSLATTRTRHVGSDPNVEHYDPDLWTDEFYFLNQPGQAEIQSDLFYDYRTNVDSYPKWQAWMREKQPRLLVIWGKYDLSFDLGEPERYRKDVPNADVHVLEAGHFALDTAADQIAQHCLRSSSSRSRSGQKWMSDYPNQRSSFKRPRFPLFPKSGKNGVPSVLRIRTLELQKYKEGNRPHGTPAVDNFVLSRVILSAWRVRGVPPNCFEFHWSE